MTNIALTPTEQARRTANAVRLGTVLELDTASARVRVQTGENQSTWLPWTTSRAGANRTWAAPEVGEQVLIACPGGDLARGVVLGALYQSAHPAPADSADVHRTSYADGAVIEYDRANHRLSATLPGGGIANIVAPGGVTITGDVTIDGNLLLAAGRKATITQGTVEILDGDVIAETISLVNHVHTGVTPGGGDTGVPKP